MNVLLYVGMVLAVTVLALIAAVMAVYGYFMLRNRVPYVVLPDGAMNTVVAKLGVRDGDVVYDLGCGDGRVIAALQNQNTKARYIGIENNLVVWGMAKIRLRGRARLVRGEILDAKFSEATRVYAYLGPKIMGELEPRFEMELPSGARLVSVQFPLPNRTPDEEVVLEESASHAERLYVYNY